ncbi:MAG: hypothetical protein VXW32_10850 [Myxococcota bacterium]|nr:hypothetical protein [Myxococcota bacterium]
MDTPISLHDIQDQKIQDQLDAIDQQTDALLRVLQQVLPQITALNTQREALLTQRREAQLRQEDAFDAEVNLDRFPRSKPATFWTRLFQRNTATPEP